MKTLFAATILFVLFFSCFFCEFETISIEASGLRDCPLQATFVWHHPGCCVMVLCQWLDSRRSVPYCVFGTASIPPFLPSSNFSLVLSSATRLFSVVFRFSNTSSYSSLLNFTSFLQPQICCCLFPIHKVSSSPSSFSLALFSPPIFHCNLFFSFHPFSSHFFSFLNRLDLFFLAFFFNWLSTILMVPLSRSHPNPLTLFAHKPSCICLNTSQLPTALLREESVILCQEFCGNDHEETRKRTSGQQVIQCVCLFVLSRISQNLSDKTHFIMCLRCVVTFAISSCVKMFSSLPKLEYAQSPN